jgi:queuine tRNA-ribosyltransferase
MVYNPRFPFELIAEDPSTSARRGVLSLPHGQVQTPAFMPVGTQGTVKGLSIDQILATGADILLGNTYHLALRPGSQRVADLGGCIVSWVGIDRF